MKTLKRFINWINSLGGFTDPEFFFEGVGDEFDTHLETIGIDQ